RDWSSDVCSSDLSLKRELFPINDLARIQFDRLNLSVARRRNIGIQLRHAITSRNGRKIVHAIVPGDFHGRHCSPLGKLKGKGGRHRKEKRVMPLERYGFDFRGQSQLEKFMGGIQNVRTPISKGAHSKVIPAAPL